MGISLEGNWGKCIMYHEKGNVGKADETETSGEEQYEESSWETEHVGEKGDHINREDIGVAL
jgi:hypothetical protein